MTDVNRWIDRLRRSYEQSLGAKLAIVEGTIQLENESASAFVNRFRDVARSVKENWIRSRLDQSEARSK